MNETYYKPIYVFNKKVPKVIEHLISKEYMRLMPYACEALNPNFEKWNSEYSGPEASQDDELADYGGTAYCEYITAKEREVLKRVNKEHPSLIIKLDVDKIGDVYAKSRVGGITMSLTLKPVTI